jgi:undecaprenyl-diphosphatase
MKAKTDTAPYKGHVKLYTIGFVVSLLTLGASSALALNGIAGWEHAIDKAINGMSGSLLFAMEVATFLGSQWMAAIAVAGAFFAGFYRLAWRLSLSIFSGYAGALILKHLVGRERPFEIFSDIHARVAETGMGFPSGHTTIATIITLTLLPYILPKWRFVLPLVVLVVGVSRIYLGVHAPLDIVGGVALGTAVVAAIRILPQPLRVFLRID